MVESIFRAAWWPTYVAVAWVATRDRDFIEQMPFDKSMNYLAVELAKYEADNKGVRSPHKTSGGAFLDLRDKSAEGRIQTTGDPYRWVGRPPRMVLQKTRVIEPLEIASAVCRDDRGTPDCLVPKMLRPDGSRFQNVLWRRSEALAQFPALEATRATERNEDEAVKALSGYVTDLTKRTDAEAWLRNQNFNLGPRPFLRVWGRAREMAELTRAAPRGRKRQA
jgi:hypothetical protein